MADDKIRPLEQLIYGLDDTELQDLADHYKGKEAVVVQYGGIVYFGKIEDTYLDKKRIYKYYNHNDKTIVVVSSKKPNVSYLGRIATVGDTIRITKKKDNSYEDVEINHISEDRIEFSNGLTYYFPLDAGISYINSHELVRIGWLDYLYDVTDNRTRNVTMPTDTPTEKTYEGDFVSQFLQDNAKNLVELEKNNKPMFDVVEMTLNFLNKKFGTGKTSEESVENVIVNAEEIVEKVKEQENLIELDRIVSEGQIFTSWTDFNDYLLSIEQGLSGFTQINVVFFYVFWKDGSYIKDKVEINDPNGFQAKSERIGLYIDRPFAVKDNIKGDIDDYQWDDEIIISEPKVPIDEEVVITKKEEAPKEYVLTKEDIENEINALEVALMIEDDEDTKKNITENIEALKISLTLI